MSEVDKEKQLLEKLISPKRKRDDTLNSSKKSNLPKNNFLHEIFKQNENIDKSFPNISNSDGSKASANNITGSPIRSSKKKGSNSVYGEDEIADRYKWTVTASGGKRRQDMRRGEWGYSSDNSNYDSPPGKSGKLLHTPSPQNYKGSLEDGCHNEMVGVLSELNMGKVNKSLLDSAEVQPVSDSITKQSNSLDTAPRSPGAIVHFDFQTTEPNVKKPKNPLSRVPQFPLLDSTSQNSSTVPRNHKYRTTGQTLAHKSESWHGNESSHKSRKQQNSGFSTASKAKAALSFIDLKSASSNSSISFPLGRPQRPTETQSDHILKQPHLGEATVNRSHRKIQAPSTSTTVVGALFFGSPTPGNQSDGQPSLGTLQPFDFATADLGTPVSEAGSPAVLEDIADMMGDSLEDHEFETIPTQLDPEPAVCEEEEKRAVKTHFQLRPKKLFEEETEKSRLRPKKLFERLDEGTMESQMDTTHVMSFDGKSPLSFLDHSGQTISAPLGNCVRQRPLESPDSDTFHQETLERTLELSQNARSPQSPLDNPGAWTSATSFGSVFQPISEVKKPISRFPQPHFTRTSPIPIPFRNPKPQEPSVSLRDAEPASTQFNHTLAFSQEYSQAPEPFTMSMDSTEQTNDYLDILHTRRTPVASVSAGGGNGIIHFSPVNFTQEPVSSSTAFKVPPREESLRCPPTPVRATQWEFLRTHEQTDSDSSLVRRKNSLHRMGIAAMGDEPEEEGSGKSFSLGQSSDLGSEGGSYKLMPLVRQSSLVENKVLLSRAPQEEEMGCEDLLWSENVSFFRDFINEGLLGSGTFADVYKVRLKAPVTHGKRESTGTEGVCHYAVKKSKRPFRSRRDRDWLLEEVRAMKLLSEAVADPHHTGDNAEKVSHSQCPFIVPFYRAWQEDSYLYVQIGLASRGTLKELLRHFMGEECREVPSQTAWHVLHDVSAGLLHMHGCGVVHLDLKPANLLITDLGRIQIGDFGMSAKMGSNAEGHDGDARYLALELLNAREPEASADIFSLGLTMYEICYSQKQLDSALASVAVGSNPGPLDLDAIVRVMELPSGGELWHKLRHGQAEPLENRPKALADAVRAAMDPEPKSRPTAGQLLGIPEVAATCSQVDPVLSKMEPPHRQPSIQRSSSYEPFTGTGGLSLEVPRDLTSAEVTALMNNAYTPR